LAQGKAFTSEQKEMIIESLREYLELGFSRAKSCKLIGLNDTTLSKWVKADEALSMKIEGWENGINKLVMQNLLSAIQKESEMDDARKETTKWWAERKMKADFSTRQEQTGADGADLVPSKINIIKPE